MKILLIEPTRAPIAIGGEDIFIYEPLALEYLAAGVADDHDVTILDLRLENNLYQVLNEVRPDVVGITSYTVHANTVKSLFRDIKQWNPDVLTVVGGHHATVIPEDFIVPSIDLIVIGEGVATFREIVTRREKKEEFDGITGIASANGYNQVQTRGREMVDLDAIPFPKRDLTEKYRKHYYSEWMKPLASIRTSKGCPNTCTFCAQWKLTGGRYFRRKPEKVVEELAGIEEENIFFADDESLIDASRMTTLANLIRDAGIRKKYFLYGRSDTIVRNPELLAMWRDIGLSRVFIGFEFVRDRDLEYIKKGSRSSDNEAAIRVLQDLDIEVYPSFIILPEFSRADFTQLRQYCRKSGFSFASFAVLTPLPGTDLYDETASQLIIHNYDYFDFIHTLLPTTLPLKEFYEEYYKLLRSSIPITKGLSFLMKYPASDIIPTLTKSYQFYNRLKRAYLDY